MQAKNQLHHKGKFGLVVSSCRKLPTLSQSKCNWKLKPNVSKTEAMIIGSNASLPTPPCFPGTSDEIKVVTQHKHLRVIIDPKLSRTPHIEHVCARTSSALSMLQPHCQYLPDNCKALFSYAYILPIFDYADTCLSG